MSTPSSARFVVLVGRMTGYTAEIDAINANAAAAIAEFLIGTPQLFHSVFRESEDSFEVLDITDTAEDVS